MFMIGERKDILWYVLKMKLYIAVKCNKLEVYVSCKYHKHKI